MKECFSRDKEHQTSNDSLCLIRYNFTHRPATPTIDDMSVLIGLIQLGIESKEIHHDHENNQNRNVRRFKY